MEPLCPDARKLHTMLPRVAVKLLPSSRSRGRVTKWCRRVGCCRGCRRQKWCQTESEEFHPTCCLEHHCGRSSSLLASRSYGHLHKCWRPHEIGAHDDRILWRREDDTGKPTELASAFCPSGRLLNVFCALGFIRRCHRDSLKAAPAALVERLQDWQLFRGTPSADDVQQGEPLVQVSSVHLGVALLGPQSQS